MKLGGNHAITRDLLPIYQEGVHHRYNFPFLAEIVLDAIPYWLCLYLSRVSNPL